MKSSNFLQAEKTEIKNFDSNQIHAVSLNDPGTRLKEAREKLGLTQDTLSRYLHLRLEVIQAIEQNDYSQNIPIVFYRGYIRLYAKLMSLPADEIVASFNQRALTHYPEKITHPLSSTPKKVPLQENKNGKKTAFALMALLLLVGGGALVGYFSEFSKKKMNVATQDKKEKAIQEGSAKEGGQSLDEKAKVSVSLDPASLPQNEGALNAKGSSEAVNSNPATSQHAQNSDLTVKNAEKEMASSLHADKTILPDTSATQKEKASHSVALTKQADEAEQVVHQNKENDNE